MATLINQPTKLRWGELEEDDDGNDLDFLLPPRQVIGPDENGIKKVIEYKFDEDNNRVKITTVTRTRKLASARVSKRAVERREWSKFGDAVNEDVGSRLTAVSTEEIVLERPKPIGSTTIETKPGDPDAVLMVRTNCGKKGDHWTARCPIRNLSQPADEFVDKPPAAAPVSTNNAYVPPSLRAGADRTGRVRHEAEE
uniref:Eukaryotic translation initiation factor 3 subunit G N-terminal domain-containing protein n=1 Tax=Medicago truncatula TaxID=3880 RepID=B7FKC5_MEDTR|nr:unknown [Medicago truncatula]